MLEFADLKRGGRMKTFNVTIDRVAVSIPEGTTILEAAKKAGIEIPTLCYHPDLGINASCRVCLVKVNGWKKLTPACSTPVNDGMEIVTNSYEVRQVRKTILELIISGHPLDCLNCIRNQKCELQRLAYEYGIRGNEFIHNAENLPLDNSNSSIIRDMSKCIKCGRCVEACNGRQGVGAIGNAFRSNNMKMTTPFSVPLSSTKCVYCGQCAAVCPVGAIYEKDDTKKAWRAIEDDRKHTIVQIAPAVRVSIGEEFGLPKGSIVTGKLVSALRRLGFDKIFDTDFTADLTIVEEVNELVDRIKNGGTLPMLTSCSPGWINFIEGFYSESTANLSSCKSPQQMFGALAKTYYAEKMGINPEDICVISIMPCTAKKYEASRSEMGRDGIRDVDIVLTTRELARMIREAGIDFLKLDNQEFDAPFGISTGAGVLFGASGGVMEAALRTLYDLSGLKEPEDLNFKEVRGMDGIKELSVGLGDKLIKVASVHGLKNARRIMESIKSGKCEYTFIEVMCCPGGCINGGGQPYQLNPSAMINRMEGIYKVDSSKAIRKSHENPGVKALYDNYLGCAGSEKAHKILHTTYGRA